MRSILLCACLFLTLRAQSETSIATNSPNGAPLSTRVVAYDIAARIDTGKKALDANETLTYKNLTGQPLTTFPFHLYLNAFRPESSFTSETHFEGGIRDQESEASYPGKKRGSITIANISANGFGDLTPLLHFTAPDDNNQNDHTVAELTLPHPIAPNDSITFHLVFHDQFPESIARNGYKRDFLMGGQWYPKLGVFWHGAWNCHQYHSSTEFFSDFATFHVRLTLPRRYIVGASGVPTGQQSNPDGTRTLSFYGEDIHDFAWAASPHFTVTDGTYLSSLGPVEVHVLALAAHPKAGPLYLKTLLGSLDQFERRYGVYPYKILTLIDPEPGSQIGGMEYPTLITGDYDNFDPTEMTEIATEHEFGHQYWYGMVATNEFEDAWLDEGINSYTERNVLAALLGPHTSAVSYPWANLSDDDLHFLEYIAAPDYDPVTRHAWLFHNVLSYGGITYGKSGTLLKTLEALIGPDVMAEAMRTYFQRYRFTHPTTENFLTTIEEVAIAHNRATPTRTILPNLPGTGQVINVGSSLRSFLNQAVYGTQVMDYAIENLHSDPVQWWRPDLKQTTFRSAFTIHRIGDFLIPIPIQVTFTDGKVLQETWTPNPTENDRWHTYTYTGPAKIQSAELDPTHILQLDRNRFNNSYTTVPDPTPARKLTTLYATGLQFVSQLAGWLV